MKLFISLNDRTAEQTSLAREGIEILEKTSRHEISLAPASAEKLFGNTEYARYGAEECDLILSFGGDGSVLKAAIRAIEHDKPLLGVNSGRLGYLCVMSIHDLKDFDILLPTFSCGERMLLETTYEDKTYYAVNDIVVGKKNFGTTSDLSVSVDNGENLRIRGDGLIFSTPTGSTAYNYSSGGPILDLDSNCYVMTPICPHISIGNSIVVNERKTVSVRERYDLANLYVDGRNVGELKGSVEVRVSEKKLMLYSQTGMKNRISRLSYQEK